MKRSDNPQKRALLYDKPLDMMTEEERDQYWLERTGEHYHEPTEEEIAEILKNYDLD